MSVEPKKRGYIEEIQDLLKALLDNPEKYFFDSKESTASKVDMLQISDDLNIGFENQDAGDKSELKKTKVSEGEEKASFSKSPKNKIEEEERLSAVNAQFWAYFALSLLTGEYLRHAGYSYSLETIVKEIKGRYYTKESRKFLHPILPVAHNLCQNLLHKCLLMRQQIEVTDGNQTLFFPEETIVLSADYSRYEKQGREIKEAEYIQNLGLKLIEMTSIDFLGIIDEEKLKSLANLYNLCEEIEASPEKHLQIFEKEAYDTKPQEIEGSGKYIIEAIKIKTSLLLYQSFFKPFLQLVPSTQDNSINVFSFDDKRGNSLYGGMKELQVVFKGKCYDKPEDLIQLDCVRFWKEKLYESKDPLFAVLTEEHIDDYDKFIQRSQETREKWNGLLNGKDHIDEDNEERVFEEIGCIAGRNDDNSRARKENVPFDIILKGLDFLRRKYAGEKKSSVEWNDPIDQMDSLLRVFVNELEHYAYKSMPYEKEKAFSNSFFRLISATNSPNLPPIFISSLGVRMLNVVLLRKTKYRLYRGIFRSWLYKAQKTSVEEFEQIRGEVKESICTSKTLKNEWSKKFKKQEKEMNNIQEDWNKTVEWQNKINDRKWELAERKNTESLDLREQEYKKELENIRSSQFTFLGIFSAIIAMLVSLVSSFKFAENVYDFMIMFGSGFSFISGLLAIVVLVKEKDAKKEMKNRTFSFVVDKRRHTKIRNWLKRWGVSILVFLLVAVGVFVAGWGVTLKKSEKPVSAVEKIRFEYEGQQKTEFVAEPTSESAEKEETKAVSDKEMLNSPLTEKKNPAEPTSESAEKEETKAVSDKEMLNSPLTEKKNPQTQKDVTTSKEASTAQRK